MKTKKSHEGYLLIDNRHGPGVSAEFVRASGKDVPFAPAGAAYESATYTCSHCHAVVVMNPERSRVRGYCINCDHYICDACEAAKGITGCVPMAKVFDDLLEDALRKE